MSQPAVEALLNRVLRNYLATAAGQRYRTRSEIQEHDFIVYANKIKEEIEKTISQQEVKIKGSQTKIVGKGIRQAIEKINDQDGLKKLFLTNQLDQIVDNTVNNILSEVPKAFGSIYKKTKDGFTITEQSGTSNLLITVTKLPDVLGGFRRRYGKSSVWVKDAQQTIFEAIRNSFKKSRQSFKTSINQFLTTYTQSLENVQTLKFGDKEKTLITGHMAGSSIVERRTQRAISQIRKGLVYISKGTVSLEKINALIDKIFYQDVFKLIKNDTNGSTKFTVGIESALFNDPSLKEIERELYTLFRESMNQAISNKGLLKEFGFAEGSDSRITIEKKKIVEIFKNQVKKSKYIKSIKTINTKIKLSKNTTASKKVNVKKAVRKKSKSSVNIPKSGYGNLAIKKTSAKNQQSKQPTLNLNALKAQINARLSMTVIKNMGTPALENRTGRFARSAIVTDVVQTSQGFPSIGYTYQKYPYQTFEPGYKQGSVDRDPRTLIDRSIREIAQQLIVGRFYTRRV
jgi:hypothetical protein